MNTNTKILLISGVCICLSIGGFIYLNQKNTPPENKATVDYSDVYSNIEIETETKAVQFDTYEEMLEYSEAINSINGLDEATDFIARFYNSCTQNNLELMLTYYNTLTWDTIMEKEAFPFYDKTSTLSFAIEDLNVIEGEEEYQYVATYTQVITDSNTKEKLAELKRKDMFELSKLFEQITIDRYVRETIEEKYF